MKKEKKSIAEGMQTQGTGKRSQRVSHGIRLKKKQQQKDIGQPALSG